MADFFAEGDFKKSLNLADELVFDKQKFNKIKVELSWEGDDLDLCAFLVDANDKICNRLDLVFWGSERRWLTEKTFDDANFNPMKGKVSVWENDAEKGFKNKDKWKERTLPLSLDDSVIGSWDDGGEGECGERMHVLLSEVDTRLYKSIIFAAVVSEKNIAQGMTFSDVKNPYVSIYDAESNKALAEYRLNQDFPGKGSVCFGKLTLDQNDLWKFITMADSYEGGMYYLAREVF